MANQLYLSECTVSSHLQHIFDKLQVISSVEVITKGIQMGYITSIL
ncbi:MAG: LuxR C-terminal-related transcriptional regulator [Clostridiaceae bacterium]